MPAIFFGHGSPFNAISRNVWTEAWSEIGRSMPKPKAILCVSAHWYLPKLAVTAMERPPTIHDFGGFPQELFDVQYPAPGSPELARRIVELLGDSCELEAASWGLDHGTWSVLCHVFPDADVPVVQLSIDSSQPAAWHYELAKKLRPIRDEGILVCGSGNLVHNLRAYSWKDTAREPYDWAERFEVEARQLIETGDHELLINYPQMGDDAMQSIPTPEHYLPLIYVLAQQSEGENASFPVEGIDGGSISMLSVQVG